jgi:hypothetical protein
VSEEQRKKGIIRCEFLMGAAAAFMVLTSIAMAVYAGGNDHDHAARGYSFIRNFFSDLGATRTYLSRLNVGSAVLFMLALALVGLAVIAFSFEHTALEGRGRLRRLGRASTVPGVISGVAFIGVAAVPWNLSGNLHELLVQVAFGFLLIFVAVMLALQIANGWSKVFLALNIVYVLILAGYVILLFFGPDPDLSVSGLEIQVIGQKIVVYASIINLGLQAYGVRRYLGSGILLRVVC